jgi:DNA-binding Lrp family transcriptional regulator
MRRILILKDVELKLISELMKNSRRSDRELAKTLNVSQPTINRIRKKLENEGYIREYTIIPDFRKLGYQLAGITMVKRRKAPTTEEMAEIRKKSKELEKENPNADLMAVYGTGLDKDVLFISFYESYEAYAKGMELVRQIPYLKLEDNETFLVDLNDQSHFRILSMSEIAKHILTLKKPTHKPSAR